MSPPPAAIAANPIPRLWWPLLLLAAAAVLGFGFAVSQRMFYPHELEWMEGALADHASRMADGLPLYCEPGPEHVPFLYAPMLFWLGGLGIALGIDAMLALRLVAVLSTIGCAALIGHWVRQESGRAVAGLIGAGLFFAGYGWLAWWYDLARNDSLFVFWVLLAGYLLRHGGGTGWRVGWFWAGLCATAALLAKQSALMWLPAIGIGALCWNWRDAAWFGLTAVGGIAVAVGLLHLCSDGWSSFYLFEMPRHHGWVGDRKLGFWTEDIVPMLPLVALGIAGFVAEARAGRLREGLYLGAVGCGGLTCSWLSRMHVGGFDNVMMYGFAGGCVLGPVTLASSARWLRVAAPLVLLLQFVWLGHAAWRRSPGVTLLPSAAHTEAHEELRAFVRAQDGPVWIPGHGGITYREGKGTGAHGQAIFDLLQMLPKQLDGMLDTEALVDSGRLTHLSARARHALGTFMSRTEQALRERYFAAVVIDEIGTGLFPVLFARGLVGADGRFGTDDDPYVRLPGSPLTDPNAIHPLLGFDVHGVYAFVRR